MQQQAWNVRRLQRSCKSRQQPMRTAASDEIANGGWTRIIEQPSTILASGIQHGAGKSRLGHESDQLLVRLAIDEHHAYQLGSLCNSCESANTLAAPRTGKKTHLDVVDASRRHRFDGNGQ